MSSYRTLALVSGDRLTPRQRRRRGHKDKRCTYVYGGDYPANESRPKGLSGHPGRRRVQLAERAR